MSYGAAVRRYVIECRKADQSLDFSGRQPEAIFGQCAITGISEDEMAKIIFRHVPDAALRGDQIPSWPAIIDPRWGARIKTW